MGDSSLPRVIRFAPGNMPLCTEPDEIAEAGTDWFDAEPTIAAGFNAFAR